MRGVRGLEVGVALLLLLIRGLGIYCACLIVHVWATVLYCFGLGLVLDEAITVRYDRNQGARAGFGKKG